MDYSEAGKGAIGNGRVLPDGEGRVTLKQWIGSGWRVMIQNADLFFDSMPMPKWGH